MTKQLEECDELLVEKAKQMTKVQEISIGPFVGLGSTFDIVFWESKDKSESQLNERKETFGKIIELLRLSCIYNLKKTHTETRNFMRSSMYGQFLIMDDLFDMPIIKTMLDLSLPLERGEDGKYSTNGCDIFLFYGDYECREELDILSLDEINDNKNINMLALIILGVMNRRAKELRLKAKEQQISLLKVENKSLKNDKASLQRDREGLMRTLGWDPNGRLKEVEDTWVICENCGKSRMLPPDISAEEVRALPDIWVCANNTWDPERSNCNAPEQNARFMIEYYERRRRRRQEEEHRRRHQDERQMMMRFSA